MAARSRSAVELRAVPSVVLSARGVRGRIEAAEPRGELSEAHAGLLQISADGGEILGGQVLFATQLVEEPPAGKSVWGEHEIRGFLKGCAFLGVR